MMETSRLVYAALSVFSCSAVFIRNSLSVNKGRGHAGNVADERLRGEVVANVCCIASVSGGVSCAHCLTGSAYTEKETGKQETYINQCGTRSREYSVFGMMV